jgi:hypothetical protein
MTMDSSTLSKKITELLTCIRGKWSECVRSHQHDEDTLLGLPYPYTVDSTKENTYG